MNYGACQLKNAQCVAVASCDESKKLVTGFDTATYTIGSSGTDACKVTDTDGNEATFAWPGATTAATTP